MILYYDEAEQSTLASEVLNKMEIGAIHCLQREALPEERCEISLTLVSKEEIHELNRDYRGVDRVTDVLSFPQFADLNSIPAEGPLVLGDVVICKEVCSEQAESYGHSFDREIVYLFVHSILHLLGYDHEEESEKREMRGLEEETMAFLNLKEGQ